MMITLVDSYFVPIQTFSNEIKDNVIELARAIEKAQ